MFLRNSNDPMGTTVVASVSEWEQFVAGAKRGEFDSLTGPAAAVVQA